ncbi:MAG TPA: hypothetical protein VE863_10300, partial [Pyrinomonadaceae bacterium]|nr:hypothetical protein [Pyrinomonadaceae bacterium]
IGLEGILIFRLFRRKRRADNADPSLGSKSITKELEAQSRVVAEPVSSVIDHTTRTLEPVYSSGQKTATEN